MYKIFDFVLDSQIPMPELQITDQINYLFSFHLTDQAPDIKDSAWFHNWTMPDGEIVLSVAKENDIYYLRFPETADFQIKYHSRSISCYTYRNVPQETVRHLLLDQVLVIIARYVFLFHPNQNNFHY